MLGFIGLVGGLRGAMTRRKRYVKVHFAVNVETREVVAMEVTTDDVHDSEVFPMFLEEAESHGKVLKTYGDGVYELSESKGVEAVVKPHRHAFRGWGGL